MSTTGFVLPFQAVFDSKKKSDKNNVLPFQFKSKNESVGWAPSRAFNFMNELENII